jgi:hypothetical protein
LLNKRLLIFFGVGVVAVGIALAIVFSTTKGAHLELQGKIIKVRTGALDDNSSIAVLDFRIQNPSDVPFVVREVHVNVDKPDGSTLQGVNVAKDDLKQLFQYNRFLGDQYNDSLTLKDTIPPHGSVDRMVAARFDLKNQDLESAKAIHLNIQDVDGTEFDTSRPVK